MWLPFALFSAFVSGGRRVYDKHLTGIFGNFAMGLVTNVYSLLPSIFLIFLLPGGTEIGTLPFRFWWPLLIIWLVLYPIQTYLMYRAVRESDLSTVTPVMCLLPVFNVGTSFILLGEMPTLLGFLGILLIVFGTYFVLREKKGDTSISVPVLMMIGAMFCIAIGSSLDKISMEASNPVFYGFMNTLGASVVFLVLMHFYQEKSSFTHMRAKFWPLMLMGVFQALSYTSTMYAFKYGSVSYVLAIRASSFLFAGLYGVAVMKENFSNRKKLAFVLFLTGVLLLALA